MNVKRLTLSALLSLALVITLVLTPLIGTEKNKVSAEGELDDVTAPTLTEIKVLNTTNKVFVPGIVWVELSVAEEDGGTGLSYVSLFLLGQYKSISLTGHNEYSFTTSFSITVTQTGEHQLLTGNVSVADRAGNQSQYTASELSDTLNITTIEAISDESEYTFTSHFNDMGLTSRLSNMAIGTAAKINAPKGSVFEKEHFDAIAGHDRTVVLNQGDIRWEVNGKDIDKEKTKDVTLSVNLETVKKGERFAVPSIEAIYYSDYDYYEAEQNFRFYVDSKSYLQNGFDEFCIDEGVDEEDYYFDDLEGLRDELEITDNPEKYNRLVDKYNKLVKKATDAYNAALKAATDKYNKEMKEFVAVRDSVSFDWDSENRVGYRNWNTYYTATEDFVKIQFYPNGELPGKMKVKFKADSLFAKNIYGGKAKIYYAGRDGFEPEDDADLNFDGTDKWCYMDVTHNSTFAASKEDASFSKAKGATYKNKVYKAEKANLEKKVKVRTIKFKLNKGKVANKIKLAGKTIKKGAKKIGTIKVIGGKRYGKLPTLTRKGYKFKGWYVGAKKITKIKITKNMTLSAKWKKK
jgi:uncharacterized repeat protein (TIGR02543 family)